MTCGWTGRERDGGSTMKAAVWHGVDGVSGETVKDSQKPGIGEVLEDVAYVCICARNVADHGVPVALKFEGPPHLRGPKASLD